MVWKLQGSPAPASKTKIGLSTSPSHPPTHPMGGLASPSCGRAATVLGVTTASVFSEALRCPQNS